MIETVLGSIDSQELGITMMHEHLSPPEIKPAFAGRSFVCLPDLDTVVEQLLQAKEYGLQSIVDCTPCGPKRNPEALRRIAEQTGLHIIASTGFYKEPNIPSFVYTATIDELVRLMVRELTEGIEGENFRAGMIKVGSSMREIKAVEEKVIRAAARAQRETGAPITTHSTLGTAGLEQIRIFSEEGVDLSKVVIGHTGLNSSFAYHKLLACYGATAGFDTIGKQLFDYVRMETAGAHRFEFEKEAYYVPDTHLAERIKTMIDAGLAANIVLSSDIGQIDPYTNLDTLGCYGYSYLLHQFVPMLKNLGMAEPAIMQMLVENPRRILDVGDQI